MKVLIIDNNRKNQDAAHRLFETIGLEHAIVDNTIGAMKTLLNDQNHDIGLVLMGCELPKNDGVKATKQIRRGYAGPCHKHTPIIALTHENDAEEKFVCLEAGVNGFVDSPLNIDQAGPSISHLLSKTNVSH